MDTASWRAAGSLAVGSLILGRLDIDHKMQSRCLRSFRSKSTHTRRSITVMTLSGRGIGFVFFLQSSQAQSGVLLHMRIECAGTDHSFDPTPDVLRLTDTQLVEHLRDLLADADNGSQRQEMQNLLFGKQEPKTAGGFIDFYGHHTLAGGWFFCGWITLGWGVGIPPIEAL